MISVVILTLNDARALALTLTALVPAAVDGLVKEVILADAGSTDETLSIAEDAGARVVASSGSVEARLAQGCARARGEWLLLLQRPAPPPAGWEAAVEAHLRGGAQAAVYWGKAAPWPWRRTAEALLAPRWLYEADGSPDERFLRLARKARRLKLPRQSRS
jgi:glycosyltransferase involved in cell wall biosynthesis